MANVHTMSVDFLHVLEVMGVEARIAQYDKSESSHFLYTLNREEKYEKQNHYCCTINVIFF